MWHRKLFNELIDGTKTVFLFKMPMLFRIVSLENKSAVLRKKRQFAPIVGRCTYTLNGGR